MDYRYWPPKKKITVLGAGYVGQGVVRNIIELFNDTVEIFLCNPRTPSTAKGYRKDVCISRGAYHKDAHVMTGGIENIVDSDVVVMTLGQARPKRAEDKKVTREDLLEINIPLVAEYARLSSKLAPNSVFINATNPLDLMTYIAHAESLYAESQVIGVGGVLDSNRFGFNIAEEFGCDWSMVSNAIVLGPHGPGMVPLVSQAYINNNRLESVVKPENIEKIIQQTKADGEYINETIGGSSEGIGAATAVMVHSIIKEKNLSFPCSVAATSNQYGIQPFKTPDGKLHHVYIGLPANLGKGGVTSYRVQGMNDVERKLLRNAASTLANTITGFYGTDGKLLPKYIRLP